MALVITKAETPDDLTQVRALCWDYRQTLLARTVHLPGIISNFYPEGPYRLMLDALPGRHVPPEGVILMAVLDGGIVACGMTQRINAQTCELKRVYVVPEARGQGAARQLCKAALDQAQKQGYRRLVLDTLRALPEAAALYRSLGFQDAAPYYTLLAAEQPHVLFFEKSLAA